jgi:hypothetical protein
MSFKPKWRPPRIQTKLLTSYTLVYICQADYSLMRQRDIIQQEKLCSSSRERNNDKPSFNGQLARGHY